MLSATSEKILEKKYYLRNKKGEPTEDFNSLCLRVSYAVAGAEKEDRNYWTGKYYELINNLWFIPGGRILANAGSPKNGNLYNCFALGIQDNRASIYNTLKRSADIFAHGGGCGYNFSHLREFGSPVSNGSKASGPVSFMGLFDYSAEVISQQSRRGAQLGILNVDHPDIYRFINAKQEEGLLTHFNLSVGLTDTFMRAAETDSPIELISRYDGKPVGAVSARGLLKIIAQAAWESGDPGIIFLDTFGKDNATPHLGVIETGNPCGETTLLANEEIEEACCLGAINLVKMLSEEGDQLVFDEEKFIYTVSTAIRFLDSIHDINVPVLPFIKEAADKTRKVALGIMGWADVLISLGIPYESDQALALADAIGESMRQTAYETSKLLAEEKGTYGAYDKDKSRNIWFSDDPVTPTRNALLLGFQPTGTTALIAGVNNSIEPFFALAYTKNVTEGEKETQYQITEFNSHLTTFLEDKPDWYREGVHKNLKQGGGLPDYVDAETQELFKTAHNISTKAHIDMQATWQKYLGGAISKTINVPNDATINQIYELMIYGWKKELKGMTIFRDGCREMQVLTVGCSCEKCNL